MTRVLRLLPPICLGCLLLASCGELVSSGQWSAPVSRSMGNVPKVTGEVQIEWMGGGGSAPAGEEKLAYAEIEWFDVAPNDRGTFRYVVYNADGSVHREIVAEPSEDPRTGVVIDTENAVAHFVGIVTSDTRTHASGGEETVSEGGCEDEHDDGGCSGEDGDGCDGGSDGHVGPAHPPGKNSRVDSIVAVVVHDGGTPKTEQDTVRWSWFYHYDDDKKPSGAATTPEIGDSTTWPDKLCAKPILGGNILVHSGAHL